VDIREALTSGCAPGVMVDFLRTETLFSFRQTRVHGCPLVIPFRLCLYRGFPDCSFLELKPFPTGSGSAGNHYQPHTAAVASIRNRIRHVTWMEIVFSLGLCHGSVQRYGLLAASRLGCRRDPQCLTQSVFSATSLIAIARSLGGFGSAPLHVPFLAAG